MTLEGWRKYTIASIKYRAKRRGMEFDLKPEDLLVPEVCPVLGITLVIAPGLVGLGYANSPSVDRKDNNRGYTKDNIVVMSNRANILKKDGTAEEFRLLAKYCSQ